MEVLIATDLELPGVDLERWRTRLDSLMEHLGLPSRSLLSLSFVSDPAISDLNVRFRDKEGSTDVLSFPQQEFGGVEEARANLNSWSLESDQPLSLGDIVVSFETAVRQAEEYGHSVERELGFLIVHGLMHLLGEDHQSPEQDEHMREWQRRCLDFWDLRV